MAYLIRSLLSLLVFAPNLAFSDTLIFAVDIIRHGDRSPIISLPSADYQWPQGLGQLTPEGMQQEYQLGVEFRKRYIEQTHLLPEQYQQGTMYVRSTDYDRTLMSAQSLLMGLYPLGTGPKISETSLPALPHAFQPIPIYMASAQADDIIVTPVNAADRERMLQEYVYSSDEWKKKENELRDKYPQWSQIFGVTISDLIPLQLLGDAVFIHQIHKAPLPEGLSADDAASIIKAGNFVFTRQLKPKQIAVAYSSKLMRTIANYLNNGSKQKSNLKYVLLSAHDSTILSALSFLEAPEDTPPPYASNLNFSLYETDEKELIVKTTYNGKPVSIPACGGTICALQQFRNYVENNKLSS